MDKNLFRETAILLEQVYNFLETDDKQSLSNQELKAYDEVMDFCEAITNLIYDQEIEDEMSTR